MSGKLKIIPLMVAGSLLLSGCVGDKFKEEALRTATKNAEHKKVQSEKKHTNNKQQEKYYKKMEKSLDEVIQENNLDNVKVMKSVKVTQKDKFQDANEFARYAGENLYQFYTRQISPEQFYYFLMNYGSDKVKKSLPTQKDALTILTTLQDMYKKQNVNGENYILTSVVFDRFKREGTFYRKLNTTNGEEYFITTIIYKNGVWKYDEDEPSPPFEEKKSGANEVTDNTN